MMATDHAFSRPAHFPPQYPHSPPPSFDWQPPVSAFATNNYGAIGSTFNSYSNNTGYSSFTSDSDEHGSTLSGLLNTASNGSPNGNGVNSSATSAAAGGGVASTSRPAAPRQPSFSPVDSADELADASPRLSDASMDSNNGQPTPPSSLSASSAPERRFPIMDSGVFTGSSYGASTGVGGMGTAASAAGATSGGVGNGVMRPDGRTSRQGRRGANRDEFDGPHQFLPRPTQQYLAMQERELPYLPTNLLVQEQDTVLSQVNDRLSQCAFDFVARYQFPIPLTQDMRPVARPQDREWTEWVQLLKRLATKRRIPARVLYNGQIKQFVTILENSLEMRHAARHQSRPLKDDRNILQLISAGIQVAKILKDAPAMDFLDRLYVVTDRQIQDRSAATPPRFR